jgi:hypothetical protein
MTTAEEWVAGFSRRLGLAEPGGEEVAHILDLARVAAHQSERRAAPLACWLAASAGLSSQEALGVAESMELPSTEADPGVS